jgi:phage virion morphogenesis protein
MSIRLEGDWSKLERHLERMFRINFTALHKEIGEHLVSSTQERFRTSTAPDGTRWPESIRAREEGGRTLRDTSRLRNSIDCVARPDRVVVGTNVVYARIHQFGGEIRARRAKYLRFRIGRRWALKRTVRIPARPFLGISDEDRTAIDKIIRNHLEERLK